MRTETRGCAGAVRQSLLRMSIPRLIGPPPRSSTPAERSSPRRRRSLPDDLLRDASRRLGIISLVAAALWSAGTVFYHLAMYQRDPHWLAWRSSDTIAVV